MAPGAEMAQPKELVAYDKETDLRIQRMAVQKVAVDAMGPFPVTSKGTPAAGAESWKEVFVGLCDFLVDDVEAAGRKVAVVAEPATVTPSSNGEGLTLDEAIKLTDAVQSKVADDDVLKNAVKLQFVKFGIKPGPLPTVISQLKKSQAKELVDLINKEA